MTQERDVRRVLDQWLADGPVELADRVLEGALLTIDHTQQRGAHVVPWRYSEMPTPLRLLLVAALMAASAGTALLFAGGARQSGPSPAPSVPAPSSMTGAGTPIGLDPAGQWSARRGAAFGSAPGDYVLDIPLRDDRLVAVDPNGREILLGSITGEGTDRTALGPTDSCPSVGHYGHALSADTNTFSISAVSDDCEDRVMLLTGDWKRTWIEQELVPGGRYRIQVNGAAIDLTVPPAFVGSSGGFTEAHGTAGPSWALDLETADLSFNLFTDPDDGFTAIDRCHVADERRFLPTTLDAYVEWSRSSAGLEVGQPSRLTIAGYPSVRLDLAGSSGCQAVFDGIPPSFFVNGISGREWAVDVDGRLILALLVDDNDPFEPLTPEILAVGDAFVASMEIEPIP